MTPLQRGCFLQSHSVSADDYFYQSIVFLVEYNEEGALGFLINRPFPRALHELAEFARLPPFPLREGGPVDQDHLYFIHRRPDLIEGGENIKPGIFYGGNFTQATAAIKQGTISNNDVLIFIGYCGWNAGDLETEIKENGWSFIEQDLFL